MMLLVALLGALGVLSNGVSAASSPSELELIAQATKLYPPCALQCLMKLVPQSLCSFTDTACLCTNDKLTADTEHCVLGACTIEEGLKTQNVTMNMCGAPIRDKHATPLAVAITGGTLSTLAFTMRMCSLLLRTNARQLGADDWFAGAALVLAAPPTLTALMFRDNGLGKDIWTLPLWKIKNVLMLYYLGSVFYIASITVVKLSLVSFMLRVFPDAQFRRICYGVMGLVGAYGICFVSATIFQCWPVDYAWHQVDSAYTGRCNNIHLQAWVAAGCNIVLDLILLALPINNLWKLNMKLKKKLMIMSMFSLGIFVTAISIVRLHTLIQFASSKNITWDYAEPGYWSLVEMHASIICACLPYCRTLLISLGANFLRSTTNSSAYAMDKMSAPSSSRRRSEGAVQILSVSKTTGADVRQQQPPRHGDEGDFVPLVDYSSGPGQANWGKQSTKTSESVTKLSGTSRDSD